MSNKASNLKKFVKKRQKPSEFSNKNTTQVGSLDLCVKKALGNDNNASTSQHKISTTDATRLVNLHNCYRKGVNVSSIRWNNQIANNAQKWANVIAKKRKMKHSPGSLRKGMGENMASWSKTGGNFKNSLANTGKMWGKEKQYYNRGKAIGKGACAKGKSCGHYTQMVWKNSREIGCGVSYYRKGKWNNRLVVCQYKKVGNMKGQAPY